MGKRRILNLLVALTISGGALFFAIRHVSLQQLGEVLRNGHYGCLLPAPLVLLLIFGLRALFWRQTLSVTREVSFFSLYSAVIIGYMANNILPLRAGEMIRALYARKLENLPLPLLISTIFIERLFDMVSLSLLLFLFFTTASHPIEQKSLWVIGGTFGLFAGLYALVYWREKVLQLLIWSILPLAKKHRLAAQLLHLAEQTLHGLSSLTAPIQLLRLFLTSLSIWFLNLIFTWLCLITFDITESPLEMTLAFLIFTNLALLIPSSPGGLGVFQLAAIYALAPYHVSENRALVLSLVDQALVIAVTSIFGYFFISRSHMSLSSMQHQAVQISEGGTLSEQEKGVL